ncbi:MAG: trypsin-like peptidase domain-containing protein [Patescibacteria group bacterium]
MYCSKCGKEIGEESKFCDKCGFQIGGTPVKNEKKIKDKKKKSILFKTMIVAIVAFLLVLAYVFFSYEELIEDGNYIPGTIDSIEVRNKDLENELGKDTTTQILATVVNIECEDITDYEYTYWGSGTILTEDGVVITNSHIIPQTEDELLVPEYGCFVTLPDPNTGAPMEIYYADPVVISGLSDDYDLAVLEIYDVYVDAEGNKYGEYPKVFPVFDDTDWCEDEYVKLGEQLKIFGYPASSGNNSLTITEGIVSNFPDDVNTILTSAKVDSGNSGGLAVDENGCMLGIPSAVSIGEYENLGIIITSEAVYEFLDELYE